MNSLVSIITVVFNGSHSIEKSIQSVLRQVNKNYQYIIIDGGSTDGTVDIIKVYRDKIHAFISEPDKGIYDAMNKAIGLANGRYLYFLGADDYLNDKFVTARLEKLASGDDDLIMGKVKYISGGIVSPRFNCMLFLHNSVHHQGTFYNSRCFENFRYDISYRLISDYELNLMLFLKRKSLRVRKSDAIIALCSDNGASRSMLSLSKEETNRVRTKCLGSFKSNILAILYNLKLKISYVRHYRI
ncbi:MAG: glycosyltransferase family 2 protein [Sphingobacterium sp.]